MRIPTKGHIPSRFWGPLFCYEILDHLYIVLKLGFLDTCEIPVAEKDAQNFGLSPINLFRLETDVQG